jgi:hypothetical protein
MRAYNAGARPQRLLWASTGTKDPKASDVLYVITLAALFTVNTMPKGTLKTLAEHGDVGTTLPADGGNRRGTGAVRGCEDRRPCLVETASRRRCAKSFVDGGSNSKGGPIPCKKQHPRAKKWTF